MPHSKSRNSTWRKGSLSRKAKRHARENEHFADDTAHALTLPSKLTPLQVKRQKRTEEALAARTNKKGAEQIAMQKGLLAEKRDWSKLSSSEFLRLSKNC